MLQESDKNPLGEFLIARKCLGVEICDNSYVYYLFEKMLDHTQYPTYPKIILKLPTASLPLGVTLLTKTTCIKSPGIIGVSWEDRWQYVKWG